MKFGLFILTMILLVGNVYAYDLHLGECSDAGSFSFNIKSIGSEKININNLKISATSPIGKVFDVGNLGGWDTRDIISSKGDGSLFVSKEAVFNEDGRYILNIENGYDSRSAVVDCPGLIFSCQLLDIHIDSCHNQDGIFGSEITIKDLKPSELSKTKVIDIIDGLDYTLSAEKPYLDIYGNSMAGGSLPKNYKLTELGDDKYLFEAEMGDNIVKSLRVAYTRKDSYKYTFELDDCYKRASKLDGNLYGFKMCAVLNSVENHNEEPVVGPPAPIEKKNNLFFYILGVVIILIIVIFIFSRKSTRYKIKTISVK